MTENPDEINDADRQIAQVIWNEGQAYAENNKISKKQNKARAESRERIKQTGIRPDAYALAVKHIKDLSTREQIEFLDDYKLVMKTMGSRQAELFPEESLKIAKREADRKRREEEDKKKAAEAATLKGVDPDTNPRSDPTKGGAGKAKAKQPATTLKEATAASDAAIKESLAAVEAEKKPGLRVVGSEPGVMKQPEGVQAESPPTAPNPPDEQAEGAAALAAGLPETTAKKSQSQIAAEIAEKAGTNGPLH